MMLAVQLVWVGRGLCASGGSMPQQHCHDVKPYDLHYLHSVVSCAFPKNRTTYLNVNICTYLSTCCEPWEKKCICTNFPPQAGIIIQNTVPTVGLGVIPWFTEGTDKGLKGSNRWRDATETNNNTHDAPQPHINQLKATVHYWCSAKSI